MLSRRAFLVSAGAAVAGTGLYTWRVEPHWVEVVRRPMPLETLPAALEGRTLLHISDIHVGPRVDPAYLTDALRQAAGLAPDFVAVTGDFVSDGGADEHRDLARVLAHLPRGRLGSVASLGNHDYGRAWSQLDVASAVERVVADAGVTVLRGEARDVGGLQFAGLPDLWSPEWGGLDAMRGLTGAAARRADVRATLAALDPARPTVTLCHNPDALDLPLWDGVRGWVLAGHTHGGQCKPPFLPPPILPVRNKRYTAGAFDVGGGRRLYINRGLGHLFRVRFNVRPELTLFTLTRGAPDAAAPARG
jgi:predicted MPP superfamily phosphohydrolase